MEQLELGLSMKERGQELALKAADDWFQTALAWLATGYEDFTADDLVRHIGLPNEVATNRNNAVGAFFSKASKAGLIKQVGWTRSMRPESHGRVIAIWSYVQ